MRLLYDSVRDLSLLYPAANHPGQNSSPLRHPITNVEPRLPANSDRNMAQPHSAQNHTFQTSRSPSSQAGESRPLLPVPHSTHIQAGACDQVVFPGVSLASQSTNNTYSAAPRPAWAANTSAGWLPQENFFEDLGSNNLDSTSYAAGQWAQLPPHSSAPSGQQSDFDFQQLLPQRPRDQPPAIRVITDSSGFPPGFQQAPQDTAYYSASSNSSVPLQEDAYHNPYPTHLSPQDTRLMSQLPHDNMNTPVSPVSAHSPHDNATLPELLSRTRKRSYDVAMESDAKPQSAPPPPSHQYSGQHSRAASVASQAPIDSETQAEEYSPRGSRSFKRGDPPMNTDNKYFCDYAPECAGQTFDRKCEWR